MVAAQIQKRHVVKLTGENAGWLAARNAVKDRGGLPSNVLHDDILVKLWPSLTRRAQVQLRMYYPAWAREVLVYPARGGQFKKGNDMVGAFKDDAGRKWVFPASSIPEQAVGREKVGLFVDPEQVEVKGSKVVVLARPASVVVLDNLIQYYGRKGKVDERTRVPLETSDKLIDDETRCLLRTERGGVHPLIRGVKSINIRRRDVHACGMSDRASGVAYVDLAAYVARSDITSIVRCDEQSGGTAPKIEVINAPENQGILVKGVTLKDFRTMVGDANANLSDLAQTVLPEKLEALNRLVKALELKE